MERLVQVKRLPDGTQRVDVGLVRRRCGTGRVVCAVALFAIPGCVLPPPEVRAAHAAGGGEAGNEAPKEVASGSQHIVWDGEGAGSGAKGWADCDQKGKCKTSLEPKPGVGADGSSGLVFHAEGKGWMGMGWNWFGWWPEDAGTDVAAYDTLKFSIQLKADKPENIPDPSAFSIGLRCSKGKADSAGVSLGDYLPNAGDGRMHEVEIPLDHLTRGKDGVFDLHSVWELNVNLWSGSAVELDVVIDNIGFKKQ